jgi:hypothetical protein
MTDPVDELLFCIVCVRSIEICFYSHKFIFEKVMLYGIKIRIPLSLYDRLQNLAPNIC